MAREIGIRALQTQMPFDVVFSERDFVRFELIAGFAARVGATVHRMRNAREECAQR